MEIVDIIENGYAVGKEDGKVYFVKNGIYGEKYEIPEDLKETKGKKGIIYIEDIEKLKRISESKYIDKNIENSVLEKSDEKFLDSNGSTLAYLDYEVEKRLKKKKIVDSFKKIAKIEDKREIELLEELEVIGEKEDRYNYRNKVTLKVKNGKIGYYKKKTNDIIEIKEDILVSEKINLKIKEIVNKQGEIYKNIIKNNIIEIIIKDVEEGIFTIYINNKGKEIEIEKNLEKKEKVYTNKIGNNKYYVGKKSFFQVNKKNTPKLYEKAREYIEYIIDKRKKESDNKNNIIRLADIYSGIGTIGIYMMSNLDNRIDEVYGLEIIEEAVELANKNVELNGLDNTKIKYEVGDSFKILKDVNKDDIILVDPPRKGLDNKLIDGLIEKEVKDIVYISCDVTTMARDIKRLKENGFSIIKISGVDMFPNTTHIETVALLSKLNT